jgi:hypothetical protein
MLVDSTLWPRSSAGSSGALTGVGERGAGKVAVRTAIAVAINPAIRRVATTHGEYQRLNSGSFTTSSWTAGGRRSRDLVGASSEIDGRTSMFTG